MVLYYNSLLDDYNKLTVAYNYERIFDSFIDSYTGGCCILYYGNAVYKKMGPMSLQNFENEKVISSYKKNFRGKKDTKTFLYQKISRKKIHQKVDVD